MFNVGTNFIVSNSTVYVSCRWGFIYLLNNVLVEIFYVIYHQMDGKVDFVSFFSTFTHSSLVFILELVTTNNRIIKKNIMFTTNNIAHKFRREFAVCIDIDTKDMILYFYASGK